MNLKELKPLRISDSDVEERKQGQKKVFEEFIDEDKGEGGEKPFKKGDVIMAGVDKNVKLTVVGYTPKGLLEVTKEGNNNPFTLFASDQAKYEAERDPSKKQEPKKEEPKKEGKREGDKSLFTRSVQQLKTELKKDEDDQDDNKIHQLSEDIYDEFTKLAEDVIGGMKELTDEEKTVAINHIHDDFIDGVENLSELTFDEKAIKENALEYKDDEDSKAPEKSPEEKEQFEAGDVLVDTEGTEWEIRRVDDRGYRLRGVDDTDAMGYITFNEAEEFDFVKV